MIDSETLQEARLPLPSSIQDTKEAWLLTRRGKDNLGGLPGMMIAILIAVLLTSVGFAVLGRFIADADMLAIATLCVLVTLTMPTLFVYVQGRKILFALLVVMTLASAGFTLVLGLAS